MRRVVAVTILAVVGFLSVAAAADPAASKLLADGRVDDAISLLETKIKAAGQDAESYNLLCRAYFMIGQWDPGIAACEKAVSFAPANSDYHSWLGRVYGEKADHSSFVTAARIAGKVRNEFETAVQLAPKSVDARDDLADFYLEAPSIVGGGREKAEAEAQEIAKLDPAEAHRVNARIAEKRKDYVTAEREYRAAIQLSAGKGGTWLNLARFYSHVGRSAEMGEALKHATAPEINRPDLLMSASDILVKSGQNEEAARLLQRYLSSGATSEDAPVFKARYLLGTILEQKGDEQGAAEQYQAALSLARSFSPARDAMNRLSHQKKPASGSD